MATQEAPAVHDRREAVQGAETFDTVVIGGGQAGLSVGYYLKKPAQALVAPLPPADLRGFSAGRAADHERHRPRRFHRSAAEIVGRPGPPDQSRPAIFTFHS